MIVMGHVTARLHGAPAWPMRRLAWKVSDGRATHVRVADMGSHP